MDQRGSREMHEFFLKFVFSLGNKFFPSGTTEHMLQISDALPVGVVKDFTEDRIVGGTHFAHLTPVNHVDDLNGVGQDWDAMSLEQTQHYDVVRSAVDAQNGVD